MRLIRLNEDHVFKPFDCGEEDLNEFLLLDAKDYLHRLMSVTYIIENDERTVAFFSVSNDRVAISDTDKATWRRIKKLFPHTKHRSDYPAVKIGRLGVDSEAENLQVKGASFGMTSLTRNDRKTSMPVGHRKAGKTSSATKSARKWTERASSSRR